MTNKNGGGRVIVPEPKFLTGTIEMKSNVELHLKNEAILLGSTNPLHYKSLEIKGSRYPKAKKKMTILN
jgi:polygalacturonase